MGRVRSTRRIEFCQQLRESPAWGDFSQTGLVSVIFGFCVSPPAATLALVASASNTAARALGRAAVVAILALTRRRTRADNPGFAFLCLPDLQSGVGGDAESGTVTCDLDGFGPSSCGGRGAFPAGPRHVACRPSMIPLPLLSLVRTLDLLR